MGAYRFWRIGICTQQNNQLKDNTKWRFSQMADIKIMSKKRFPSYKNYVANLVEQKREKDKDWAYLVRFITNFIERDCKYALTGKQIKELLDLAN